MAQPAPKLLLVSCEQGLSDLLPDCLWIYFKDAHQNTEGAVDVRAGPFSDSTTRALIFATAEASDATEHLATLGVVIFTPRHIESGLALEELEWLLSPQDGSAGGGVHDLLFALQRISTDAVKKAAAKLPEESLARGRLLGMVADDALLLPEDASPQDCATAIGAEVVRRLQGAEMAPSYPDPDPEAPSHDQLRRLVDQNNSQRVTDYLRLQPPGATNALFTPAPKDGLSALHYAAQQGKVCALEAILQHLAEARLMDHIESSRAAAGPWEAMTALHLAAAHEQRGTAELLLLHAARSTALGGDVVAGSANAPGSSEGLLELLLLARDSSGRTALHLAAKECALPVAEVLLDAARGTFDTDTATDAGSRGGSGRLVRDLLLAPDGDGYTALQYCCAGCHDEAEFERVKRGFIRVYKPWFALLLSNGVDVLGYVELAPAETYKTPLHAAAEWGNYVAAGWLLEACPSDAARLSLLCRREPKHHWTPLHSAAAHGNGRVVETLLRHAGTELPLYLRLRADSVDGGKPAATRSNSGHVCSGSGHVRSGSQHRDGMSSDSGFSALHVAVYWGHRTAATTLMQCARIHDEDLVRTARNSSRHDRSGGPKTLLQRVLTDTTGRGRNVLHLAAMSPACCIHTLWALWSGLAWVTADRPGTHAAREESTADSDRPTLLELLSGLDSHGRSPAGYMAGSSHPSASEENMQEAAPSDDSSEGSASGLYDDLDWTPRDWELLVPFFSWAVGLVTDPESEGLFGPVDRVQRDKSVEQSMLWPFLSPGPWRNKVGQTLLSYAAAAGHEGMVRWLVHTEASRGAQARRTITFSDRAGLTAWHHAARAGSIECLKWLVRFDRYQMFEPGRKGVGTPESLLHGDALVWWQGLKADTAMFQRAKQMINDSSSGLLVGAAVIAGVAFNAVFNPPHGWTDPGGYFPSKPTPLVAFYWLNGLSLYCALSSIALGAGMSLPQPERSPRRDLRSMVRWVFYATLFLLLALLFFALAFAVAVVACAPHGTPLYRQMVGMVVAGAAVAAGCVAMVGKPLWLLLDEELIGKGMSRGEALLGPLWAGHVTSVLARFTRTLHWRVWYPLKCLVRGWYRSCRNRVQARRQGQPAAATDAAADADAAAPPAATDTARPASARLPRWRSSAASLQQLQLDPVEASAAPSSLQPFWSVPLSTQPGQPGAGPAPLVLPPTGRPSSSLRVPRLGSSQQGVPPSLHSPSQPAPLAGLGPPPPAGLGPAPPISRAGADSSRTPPDSCLPSTPLQASSVQSPFLPPPPTPTSPDPQLPPSEAGTSPPKLLLSAPSCHPPTAPTLAPSTFALASTAQAPPPTASGQLPLPAPSCHPATGATLAPSPSAPASTAQAQPPATSHQLLHTQPPAAIRQPNLTAHPAAQPSLLSAPAPRQPSQATPEAPPSASSAAGSHSVPAAVHPSLDAPQPPGAGPTQAGPPQGDFVVEVLPPSNDDGAGR